MRYGCSECVSSSSSCYQTFSFHCSVHWYPISLNLRRSSNVQGCVKREHRNICAVFYSSSPHAHVVSPLKYPHFFLCSLLQVYPVRSLFRHRHMSQRLLYPLAGSSFMMTMRNRDLSLVLLCHSLHRTICAGK